MKIYILDDKQDLVDSIQQLLAEFGFQSEGFTSGSDFFSRVSLKANDLLILDVYMPHYSGIRVLRELANKRHNPKLLLMSGHGKDVLDSACTFARSLGLNVIDGMTKPFSHFSLRAVLTRALNDLVGDSESHQQNPDSYSTDELKAALVNNQLEMFYQPQLNLRSQKINQYEALVRWHHPKLGTLTAKDFINVNLNRQWRLKLGLWGLKQIGKDAAVLGALPDFCSVAMNISACSIADPEFILALEKLLDTGVLKPGQITLEVVESEFLPFSDESLDNLIDLRVKGIKLSIDDFGTGFSSLTLLRQIPFSELKIDKSFVAHLLVEEQAQFIVSACLELARKMGLKTVAEGVETLDVLNYLREQECDIAQGYEIGYPMAIGQLDSWFASRQQNTVLR